MYKDKFKIVSLVPFSLRIRTDTDVIGYFSNTNMESDRKKFSKSDSDASILKSNTNTDIYIYILSEYEYG